MKSILALLFLGSSITLGQQLSQSVLPKIENGKCFAATDAYVTKLGPRRDQGNLAYCYGMAAAQALEQVICKSNGPECSYPRDQVSVLHLLRASKEGKIQEFGWSNSAALSLIGERVARESCASYQTWLDGGKRSRFKQLEDLFHYTQGRKGRERCLGIEAMQDVLGLKTRSEEILQALRHVSFEDFLGEISIARSCFDQGLDVPPVSFNAMPYTTPMDKNTIPQFIAAGLKSDSPIVWGYCEEYKGDQCIVSHAVLIVGHQVKCCKDEALRCESQYLIRDTWKRPGNDPKVDRTIGVDELIERTLKAGDVRTSLNGSDYHEQLFFLTPPKL